MLIAVAAKDGKIARFLETVNCFELYKEEEKKIAYIGNIDFSKMNLNTIEMIEQLYESDIKMIVVGNMDHEAEDAICKAGMLFIRDTVGKAEDVLEAWKEGYIKPVSVPACTNARLN